MSVRAPVTKDINFEYQLDTKSMTFKGYASTFGNIDSDNDIIMPGAFTKSIKEAFPANKVKVLRDHIWENLIGKPGHMEQDSKGLFTETKLSKTTLGLDTMILLEDEVIDKMSIGFWIPQGKSFKRKDGVKEISEVALMEYSLVTFPANDQAAVTSVSKSMKQMLEYAKGDISEVVKQELLQELDAIKSLLSNQPRLSTETDHSRHEAEIKRLIREQFKL